MQATKVRRFLIRFFLFSNFYAGANMNRPTTKSIFFQDFVPLDVDCRVQEKLTTSFDQDLGVALLG